MVPERQFHRYSTVRALRYGRALVIVMLWFCHCSVFPVFSDGWILMGRTGEAGKAMYSNESMKERVNAKKSLFIPGVVLFQCE